MPDTIQSNNGGQNNSINIDDSRVNENENQDEIQDFKEDDVNKKEE